MRDGAHLVGDAPGIEMLHRALREILPLRDALRLHAPLDQRAGDTAQAELDRERNADRSAADDDDLMPFLHTD